MIPLLSRAVPGSVYLAQESSSAMGQLVVSIPLQQRGILLTQDSQEENCSRVRVPRLCVF